MYGSYGSYSSTSAMDIPSRSNTYHSSTHHEASCAFPSWPRRDSLTNDHMPRASAYISDEDLLFLSEPLFPDDDGTAHSESSSYGSRATPSPTLAPAVMHISDEDIEEMRREQAMRQREYMAGVMREKEQRRRRQAAKNKSKAAAASTNAGGRKAVSPAPKSKLSAMTPIAEAAE
ncbi:unnamed protein product [Discula destructiva]